MLNFQNTPPDDPRGVALPLKRCPPGRGLVAIVTSPDLLGCATHFFHGRTHPCTSPNCDPCHDGIPWRWHSYLSAWNPVHKIHFLWESTARATEPFTQYRQANGTLRGCQFSARRINTSPNSRVMVETKPADLQAHPLPDAPDLLKILSIIWNIPLSEMEINSLLKDVAQVRTMLDPTADLKRTNKRIPFHDEAVDRKPA